MIQIRRNGQRSRKKHTENDISAILIFILAVAVSLGIFLISIQNSIEESSAKTIMTNVSRQSEHISTILNIHYGYLNGIAEKMAKSDDLLSEENMNMLVSLTKNTELERVALIEKNGTAHYDNGMVKNASSRRYFREGMRGKETLSDPLESSVDSETRVVLGVPVWKGKKIQGVLGGSYNVTTLSRMLFNDFFDGVGYALVATSEGEIIAHDGAPAYHKITYGDNLFRFYEEKTLLDGTSLKNAKEDFAAGRDGLIKMRNGNDHMSEQYLAYTNLGLNDWMICYVIPVSEAQKTYDFIKKYELFFTIGFIIMVSILFFYVIGRSTSRNRLLLQAAQTDALTSAYNKKSTEEQIDYILQEYAREQGTFVIMDVDYFKGVNDRYGHITGDKVLHQFGEVLREHFREGDIIGRIGGDEFVVFMRKTENREAAVSRIESLIGKIKKLHFPEMNGENVTISAGISFAPEHGTEYLELYKNADKALYQTKQAGRDGYYVYQDEER